MVFSFFQILWTTYGRNLLDQKITTRVLLMGSPFHIVNLHVLPFQHGLSGRNMLNLFGILIYASTTQKTVCSFELSRSSCLLTLVYQLIVKSICAFVHRCFLILWSVKPFCPECLGETNSSTSSISRIGSKKLCSADQIANPAFVLLYLGVLPSLYRDCYRNCTPSYELLVQWYFLPSLFIPRFLWYCNRNADKWIVVCEINTASNFVAW